MRGSRNSRRAAAQRAVRYAEPSLDDDFQVGSESEMDEAEGEGNNNGRSSNRREKPQHSAGRSTRATDSSCQTRSKCVGRGGGGVAGRIGVTSSRVAKKSGPPGRRVDAKTAAADSETESKNETELSTAVDEKTAAMEDNSDENSEDERKSWPGRSGQASREGAVNGKRASSRVRATTADYSLEVEHEVGTEGRSQHHTARSQTCGVGCVAAM